MSYKRVNIDSLNLKSDHLESIFIHNEDYWIQTVKNKVVFEPTIWRETFGKPLQQNIVEAKIIHTYRGVTIPLKTFASTQQSQTVEFAGLYGYNRRSEQLVITYKELESHLQYTIISRIDIAIDFEGNIPKRVIKTISKTRKPFRYGNTTYYKTAKEKKTNQKMDIKIYNKAHQAKLDYPLMRLEIVFKGNYFQKPFLKDMDLAIKQMEKSIKRATGLSVKIQSI